MSSGMFWLEQMRAVNWGRAATVGLAAYLVGCFATGFYLVRWRTGQDIRRLGSGSVGARNVGRVLGWMGFGLTLLGDFAKGAVAVWGTRQFTPDERLAAVAMLAVVAGHVWPLQLRGHGGKGMATGLGALALYDFHLAVAGALLFAGGFALARRTVLPALFAAFCLPWVSVFLGQEPAKVVAIFLLAGLVLVAHRRNLIEEVLQSVERRHLHAKHHPPEL